ncbi:MAG: hypothetical protein ABI690_24825 [Chloroflexota bacterium]
MRKTLLLLVFMLAVFGGVASAQELPTTFCGKLSDADCGILTDSGAAMRGLHSAAFNFQLDVNLTNVPESNTTDVHFKLTGNGAYAITPEALSALMLSPSEMLQNMDKMPQILEDAIKAISADTTLILFLPPNLPGRNEPLPDKVGLSLRMVDGIGYANLDKLAGLDSTGDMPHGWVGVDLAGYLQQSMNAQAGAMSGLSGMNLDTMSALTDPDFINSYMTVTRSDDTTIDGQNAAVFNQSIDLGALFSSDTFQKMIREQLNSSSSVTGMGANNIDSVLSLYSTLFKGFVVNATQTIGLEDHFVHQINMTLDWALDFSGIASSFGDTGSTISTPPINISLNLQAGLSHFNNAPEITAPDNAVIMPLDKLFQEAMADF